MLVLYHSRVLKQWDFRLRLELLRRLDDHGAEDAGGVVGALAGAHADGLDGEALGKGGFRAQSGGRGGARGGDELAFHVHRESVNPAASAMNAVAGAGTGMRPCWQRTVPYPQGRSDTTTPSGAKSSAATAMAIMSAMESTAPTSWK